MSRGAQVATALVAASASAIVIATVHTGWIDAGDGLVLVLALAALVRSSIRLASGPDDPTGDARYNGRPRHRRG